MRNRTPQRRSANSGQVVLEFVIMLVLGALLAAALLTMFRTVSLRGDRMTDRVSFSVP